MSFTTPTQKPMLEPIAARPTSSQTHGSSTSAACSCTSFPRPRKVSAPTAAVQKKRRFTRRNAAMRMAAREGYRNPEPGDSRRPGKIPALSGLREILGAGGAISVAARLARGEA